MRTPMTSRTRKTTLLHIDWTRCAGRGLCAEILAGHVARDEWGYPLVKGGNNVALPNSSIDAAQQAVAACPLHALRLLRTDVSES